MDFVQGLIEWYNSTLTAMWSSGAIGKIFAIILIVVTLALAFLVYLLVSTITETVTSRIHWYNNRVRCVHCNSWTLHFSEGDYPECHSGEPCCLRCDHDHEMTHEDKFRCPIDGTVMTKESIDGTLIKDVCSDCGGAWLSQEELDRVTQMAYDRGLADGRATGMATGLAIGIAT